MNIEAMKQVSQPAQATQAEVTDNVALDEQFCGWIGTLKDAHDESLDDEHASSRSMLRGVIAEMEEARAILALRPQQSGLTGCNCRWDGDTQVQWCELHLAHKEAIHEWAERAKSVEQQLALRPERVPMTAEQRSEIICRYDEGKTYSDLVGIILATEAHHGFTAQAQKSTDPQDTYVNGLAQANNEQD